MVDFTVNNRLIEVKASKHDYALEINKYALINEQLQKQNKKLEILFPTNFSEVFNIDPSIEKPLTFFEAQIIENVKNGECKMVLPLVKNPDIDFTEKSFIKSFGENPLQIIKNGELLYENKKCKNRD